MALRQRIFRYDCTYYGGLSCAYFTHDVHEVAGVYVHVEVIDDFCFSAYYVRVAE